MWPSSRPRPLDNAMQCRHVIIKKDDGAKNNRKPLHLSHRFHNKTLLLKESIIAQATCRLNYISNEIRKALFEGFRAKFI